MDGEVGHGPPVGRTDVEVVAVVDAGAHQRLDQTGHVGRVRAVVVRRSHVDPALYPVDESVGTVLASVAKEPP